MGVMARDASQIAPPSVRETRLYEIESAMSKRTKSERETDFGHSMLRHNVLRSRDVVVIACFRHSMPLHGMSKTMVTVRL